MGQVVVLLLQAVAGLLKTTVFLLQNAENLSAHGAAGAKERNLGHEKKYKAAVSSETDKEGVF